MKEEEESSYGIQMHKGVSIEKIDRAAKTVTDSNGNTHTYDYLLMGTGSRANMPKDVPKLEGIFSMRTRYDADKLKAHVPVKGKVIIVGGGLLGIELAASLREIDIEVCIIQRISRLMDRQLDLLGSQLLHEELVDKGIEIFYNDELQTFQGKEKVSGIKLKSGRTIDCDAIVFAVGTTPNIELAKEAGLDYKRGVLINDYLQTSDPYIYAVGEIAEHNQFLYGFTAAAEQQAEILARHLNGDPFALYKGTLLMNILKIQGVNLCTLGIAETPDHPDYEEVVFIDKAKRYYKKCIIHKDKLVGAILIGDKSEFKEFKDMMQNDLELSDKRIALLRSGKAADAVEGKLVCSCNNVGAGNLINKIKGGCEDFKELCQLTGAGMGCGSCRPEVKAILEKTVTVVSC
jgi:ferredoxin-nitrate reductase